MHIKRVGLQLHKRPNISLRFLEQIPLNF